MIMIFKKQCATVVKMQFIFLNKTSISGSCIQEAPCSPHASKAKTISVLYHFKQLYYNDQDILTLHCHLSSTFYSHLKMSV